MVNRMKEKLPHLRQQTGQPNRERLTALPEFILTATTAGVKPLSIINTPKQRNAQWNKNRF